MTEKISKANLSDIKFDKSNANKGSERGRYLIETSMREFGFADAGTLDRNNVIIGGNKRTEVAGEISLGDEAIIIDVDGTKPVYIRRNDLNLSDPNDDRARKLAYALNRSSEISMNWDAEQLLADLSTGLDLSSMFREDELDALLAELQPEPEPVTDAGAQVDKAEELRQKWGVELGQMWALGDDHRLICGDCTDAAVVARLMGCEKAVLCVTDPPYAVSYNPQWRVGLGGGGTQEFANGVEIEGDDNTDWLGVFNNLPADVLYCWTADRTVALLQSHLEKCGFIYAYMIVWNKDLAVFNRGDYHYRFEPCLYMVRKGNRHNWQGDVKAENVWDIPTIHSFANGKSAEEWGLLGHGNQKPLECMARPIRNNSAVGEIVYDPFSGSGTTIIACEQLGRKCRAVEISGGYVGVALQRFFDSTQKLPVLVE